MASVILQAWSCRQQILKKEEVMGKEHSSKPSRMILEAAVKEKEESYLSLRGRGRGDDSRSLKGGCRMTETQGWIIIVQIAFILYFLGTISRR
jgi:hypothetical protein